MNQQEFDKVVKETWENIQTLLEVKGGEYAGTEDRLGNFKRGASLTGAHSLQVLFIYLSKHYDAFATYVRDTASGESRPRSESITGRLDDIINYCILAKALVRELENEVEANKRDKDRIHIDIHRFFEYVDSIPGGLPTPESFAPKPGSPLFGAFKWKDHWWARPESSQCTKKWIKVSPITNSINDVMRDMLAMYHSGAWNV